ncbi:MAG: pirin family protein [Gammaproteobacteria bacterium]|nr:MAG: pirin family protein [Gammaproteobacteria bacterium]
MLNVRRSNQRGSASFDWLRSKHTFSFGNYHDETQMGFSELRVINDDEVIPEGGFATHGHRDMEIISYVLSGEIAHKDSEGNITRLPPGEFQLMSAGSGIRHSEFNPSLTKKLHFLQIWIQPNVFGQKPGYQQKDFGSEKGLTLVVSPNGADGSLHIKQDAKIYQLILTPETTTQLNTDNSRRYYVHNIEGPLVVKGNDGTWETLQAGDGVKIESLSQLQFSANNEAVKALVFDLP